MPFDPLQFASKWVADHLSPRYSSMLALILGFLLWAPEPWLKYLHLLEFSQNYRWAIALAFLVSIAVLMVSVLTKIGTGATFWFGRVRQKHQIRKYMLTMPTDQLGILLEYAQREKSSLNFQPTNGAVQDLENRGILYRSSPLGNVRSGFPYSIHPNAAAFLRRKEFQKILLERTKAESKR